MKTCSKCKIKKELPCFSKNNNTFDKLQYRCKDCNIGIGKLGDDIASLERELTYLRNSDG